MVVRQNNGEMAKTRATASDGTAVIQGRRFLHGASSSSFCRMVAGKARSLCINVFNTCDKVLAGVEEPVDEKLVSRELAS